MGVDGGTSSAARETRALLISTELRTSRAGYEKFPQLPDRSGTGGAQLMNDD